MGRRRGNGEGLCEDGEGRKRTQRRKDEGEPTDRSQVKFAVAQALGEAWCLVLGSNRTDAFMLHDHLH